MLRGKKILLGISGSIAAYKTPNLVRLLVKEGAEVQVVMTEAAATLVAPLSLSTVSKHKVFANISSENEWNNHVALGYWADIFLIAPASANTLAHLANGFCNNLLQAIYLSSKCEVVFAPAMDSDMWLHKSVQENIDKLQQLGHHFIPVEDGELASGLIGPGRMAEPEHIVAWIADYLEKNKKQTNKNSKKAVISAGPTYEMIDPVRFIGNMSSGKMGIAIANALVEKGWNVDIILGPGVNEQKLDKAIKIKNVISAEQMKEAVIASFKTADLAVMAAAVADFRPKHKAQEKIKKGQDDEMSIEMVKNPDILAWLGAHKKSGQTVVGFALESNNELENAKAKLIRKNADFIALNSLNDEEVGFGKDTSKILLISEDNNYDLGVGTKDDLAKKMVAIITEKIEK